MPGNLEKGHWDKIAAYRAGDFEATKQSLMDCKKHNHEQFQELYNIYTKRIDALIKSPPKDWNGVYIAETK